MEYSPSNNIGKPENTPNQEGIDFVFEQYPELSSIGSKEQYAQYLKTIFPKSSYGDIVYHRTDAEFENFDKKYLSSSSGYGKGFYFRNKKPQRGTSMGDAGHLKLALVNIKNMLIDADDKIYEDVMNMSHPIEFYLKDQFDGVRNPLDLGKGETIVLYEPEQIHILGSKNDAEKFKDYIAGKNEDSDAPAPV
jgi:hypothetical protein